MGLIPVCPVIDAAIEVASHTPIMVNKLGTKVISVNTVSRNATAAKTIGAHLKFIPFAALLLIMGP